MALGELAGEARILVSASRNPKAAGLHTRLLCGDAEELLDGSDGVHHCYVVESVRMIGVSSGDEGELGTGRVIGRPWSG